jgi:hypothetical protein
MTIEQAYGRTAFTFRPELMLEGQQVEGLELVARPVINPLRREIWTLTAAGTATAGAYSGRIRGPGVDFTHTFTRVGETSAQVAEEWAEGLLALAARKNVVLTAEVSTADIAVRFKHAGISYRIDGTAVAPATFLAVETLSQEGEALVSGRFAVHATLEGQASCAPPGNSAAKTDIAGVIMRPVASLARPNTVEITTPPSHPAGRMVAPATQVIFAARNYGTVASAAGGQVFVVRNTAGGQSRGVPRSNADGSNTVALDLSQARWLTVAAPDGLGAMMVTL